MRTEILIGQGDKGSMFKRSVHAITPFAGGLACWLAEMIEDAHQIQKANER